MEKDVDIILQTGKITSILDEFLTEYECTSTLTSDFCYFSDSNIIGYSFLVEEVNDALFMNVINSLSPIVSCDIFLWSFLHELGHHQTIEDFSIKELKKYYKTKAKLSKRLSKAKTDLQKLELKKQYFVLPDEYAATAWAVNFVNANLNKVQALWTKLQPEILEFYKKNELLEA